MNILTLTNLYPPHHAGTYDYRCQIACDDLRSRGHRVRVLTSNHGLTGQQKSGDTVRQLLLNGQFGVEKRTGFLELKDLEESNNASLREAIEEFSPDVVLVWSLMGLSKSMIFTLEQSGIPTVYDIADDWLLSELKADPWLDFWNAEKLPFKEAAVRKSLEMSGQRDAWDKKAPTRFDRSIKRMPYLYSGGREAQEVEPGSIHTFAFKRIYFCSLSMKDQAWHAGFNVNHADVIQPLIRTDLFKGEVKPESDPANRMLLFRTLEEGCGAMTALKALAKVRETNPDASLDMYGDGDSQYVARLRSFAVQNGIPLEIHPISDPLRELPNILPRYDIFLHPTEGDESLCSTPLEAMACGLPVIGTLRGGIGSFLFNEDNALTFLAGDEIDLAEKIQTLQAYPDYRARIATCGHERVLGAHGVDVVMTWIESYLQDTITYWPQL